MKHFQHIAPLIGADAFPVVSKTLKVQNLSSSNAEISLATEQCSYVLHHPVFSAYSSGMAYLQNGTCYSKHKFHQSECIHILACDYSIG